MIATTDGITIWTATSLGYLEEEHHFFEEEVRLFCLAVSDLFWGRPWVH